MRDFCNAADRDCIRLIVAQDLKECGIDVDASNFSTINTSHSTNSNNNNSCINHYHNHHSHSHSHHILNTSGINNSNINHNYFHNTSECNIFCFFWVSWALIDFLFLATNNSDTTTSNQHDSQLVITSPNKIFGVNIRQLEMVNLTINEQLLTVPMWVYFVKYYQKFFEF